ncbi:MAG: hypothetical protein LAT68_00845 [Cyclobacteriaceae bacterium]|nr:hypothetical protein [Cyclobacteriaceae bacterium]MCH8514850.1 hypothetical protein [Cyclobacteriaceae bacterium]
MKKKKVFLQKAAQLLAIVIFWNLGLSESQLKAQVSEQNPFISTRISLEMQGESERFRFINNRCKVRYDADKHQIEGRFNMADFVTEFEGDSRELFDRVFAGLQNQSVEMIVPIRGTTANKRDFQNEKDFVTEGKFIFNNPYSHVPYHIKLYSNNNALFYYLSVDLNYELLGIRLPTEFQDMLLENFQFVIPRGHWARLEH